MIVGAASVAALGVISAGASSSSAGAALALLPVVSRDDSIQQAMQLTADALSVKYNMSIALA